MLIESSHDVVDQDAFWGVVDGVPTIPAGVNLVSFVARADRSRVTCLWDAHSDEEVRRFLDPVVGQSARNSYHPLDEIRSDVPRRKRTGAAGPYHLHEYGKQLLRDGQREEAFAVFVLNAKKYPKFWIVQAGLARGYAALGEGEAALQSMRMALESAPKHRLEYVQGLLLRLKRGEDINAAI